MAGEAPMSDLSTVTLESAKLPDSPRLPSFGTFQDAFAFDRCAFGWIICNPSAFHAVLKNVAHLLRTGGNFVAEKKHDVKFAHHQVML
jgi:hypothetical protein